MLSHIAVYSSAGKHLKTPQNAVKRSKTQQTAAKRCEMPQNAAKRRNSSQNAANALKVIAYLLQNPTNRSKCTRGRRQFPAKRRKNSNYMRDSVSQDSKNQKSNHENGKENESEEDCMEICKEEASGSENQQFRGQF